MGKQKIYDRQGIGAAPIVFALIPLLLFGGFFIFSQWHNVQIVDNKPIIVSQDTAQGNINVDSDNDGLKDWEEQIYGTDPHNPDTDGDGTKDGDEIAQGRDPLKPGPNDLLTKKTSITTSSPASGNDKPTLTQKLAEVFGQDYLLNLIHNPKEQPDLDAIADKMAQVAVNGSTSRIPPTSVNDITVSHDTSKATIQEYITQTNNLILRFFPKNEKDPMLIFKEALEQNNLSILDTLDKRIQSYDIFLVEIKKIPVPNDFISLHLRFINTTVKEREAITNIRDAKNDMVLGLIGVQELDNTAKEFMELQKQYTDLHLSIYFDKK